MRAHTITIVLGICALAIPASANAEPIGSSDYSSVNAATDHSAESTQPAGSSSYGSVNSIAPPASEPSGSQSVDSGYSSLNAVSGAPTNTPTLVSGPADSGDGFDWGSALVGAGTALAMAALGTATLLTVRRRTVSPSASPG